MKGNDKINDLLNIQLGVVLTWLNVSRGETRKEARQNRMDLYESSQATKRTKLFYKSNTAIHISNLLYFK